MRIARNQQEISYTLESGEVPNILVGKEHKTMFPTDIEISFSTGIVVTNGNPKHLLVIIRGKVFCETHAICSCADAPKRNFRYDSVSYNHVEQMPDWAARLVGAVTPEWWTS